jgi:hypothetical protein
MTDSGLSYIQYRRILPSEIFELDVPEGVPSIVIGGSLTLGVFSIDIFPPSGNELRSRISVVSRDLCGDISLIHEDIHPFEPHIASAHINQDIQFQLPESPMGCGSSLLFEVELVRSGRAVHNYWAIYPITHFRQQIKRIQLRESDGPFNPDKVMDYLRSNHLNGSSCYVYFSLRESESPVKLTSSRVSMTPLNLTPRNTDTVLDMHAIEEWGKSWIGSSSRSTETSSIGIDVVDLKNRILSQIMSRYSR